MPSTVLAPAPTLGAQLERERLEHRVRRIERVLVVLRHQRRQANARGRAPSGLEQAIAGFGEELGDVRDRLRALD
jgi:hypothetical protein